MAGLYERNGVWWTAYTDGDGKRIRRSLKLRDKRLAQIAVGDIERRIAEGRVGIATKTPADHWSERIAYAKSNVAPSTARRYIPRLQRMATFFTVLTPQRINEWVELRRSSGTAISTINYEIGLVRGMLPPDEARKVKMLKDRAAATRRPRYLSSDEVRRLLDACPYEFARIVRGYLYTGARLMELRAVTWDMIGRGTITLPNLKTVRSKRDAYRTMPILHPDLAADLKAVKARGDERPWSYPGQWNQQIRYHLIRYARKAGIPWLTKVHTLRKTFASHLVTQGVGIYQVSKWLGHASVTQTEADYAYLMESAGKDVVLRY